MLNAPAQARLARVLPVALRCGCLGWLIVCTHLNLSAAVYRAGTWPIEVTLQAEHATLSLGEPLWLSYTVRNLSDDDLQILVGGDTQNTLGRPASFSVTTVRTDGRRPPQPDVGPASSGLVSAQPLPAGGSHVFRLFLPHWATFQEPGSYTISCRRTLQLLRAVPGRDFRQQEIVEIATEGRVDLSVQARDATRIGRLITEFGDVVVSAEGEKSGDEALIALAWIDDPRVVPYFRQVLAMRSYALKFIAVQAFAKFATNDAFEGLKAAMATKPSDFDAGSDAQPRVAAKLRAAAAGALSRCKHPRAREFLLAQRRDEYEDVRLMVVLTLGRMPAGEAVPLLQEMARDPSTRVRDEANRHLARLGPAAESSVLLR